MKRDSRTIASSMSWSRFMLHGNQAAVGWTARKMRRAADALRAVPPLIAAMSVQRATPLKRIAVEDQNCDTCLGKFYGVALCRVTLGETLQARQPSIDCRPPIPGHLSHSTHMTNEF